MELYSRVSYIVSRQIIFEYSTSFSSSMRLFSKDIQPHIAAVYGLVRIADEVVDAYRGVDAAQVLQELEEEVYAAIDRGYSTNPAVHSFAMTARECSITDELVGPFFNSMRMDTVPQEYDAALYGEYIYGSAEVIGLMCLRIFINGNNEQYAKLEAGARALGAAYQKVNFLRDIAADFRELGRTYFPNVEFSTFDDAARDEIIADIERDFSQATVAIEGLPHSSRRAVWLSVLYYRALLRRVAATPAIELRQKRVRVGTVHKALLFARAYIAGPR